ncbi:14044_t:CDS:2, partial [Dentiscutata heterogama]
EDIEEWAHYDDDSINEMVEESGSSSMIEENITQLVADNVSSEDVEGATFDDALNSIERKNQPLLNKKKDNDIEVRMFGEQYECDWWHETEKKLPPLNCLLSIILYSDATTFDSLGKTSGHPVFLTLGNIPTWLRNSADSKVLLGFLPKVQACVPDRMHHIDLGLFKYQLNFTQEILKKVSGVELQRNFDDRLRHIPRFPGLKLYSKLGQLKIMTAADYQNLMKLYAKFSNMYIMSRQESYSETDLNNFEVKRNELAPTVSKVICRKTKGFGKVLYELKLDAIETRVNSLKSSNQTHPNFIEGLSQLIPALNAFLDMSSQDSVSENFFIKIYDSVHLESGEILRASDSFQNKEWFSNVAVSAAEDQVQYESDDGIWYGKVLIFLRFFWGSAKDPFDLAMVRWYDIEPSEPELYGCPQLFYTNDYDIIPIGSIYKEAHIVPRFDKENRFLLNKYMF